MYKYINFNNLKTKKGFTGGGVVVGWSSPLWKHKKQLRKHKKEEKTQKIIYYLNSEKTMKTSFYYYKKK